MSNVTDLGALLPIAERVGASLVDDHGGFLRCETCRSTRSLTPDSAAGYMSAGWPVCCGHTMHWWTARQVRDGEVPA